VIGSKIVFLVASSLEFFIAIELTILAIVFSISISLLKAA
jgi:hypothetical protein